MDEMKSVSVNMVTANHASFLGACLSSLQDQDASVATVTVIDNASDDGTVHTVERNYPEVTVLRNFRPLGTARALNQATALALSRWDEALWPHRYVVFTVPEAEFAPDCLRLLLEVLEKDATIVAATPLILRAQVRVSGLDEDRETERTETVETAGISLTPSRKWQAVGGGESAAAHQDVREVFGAPRAACIIRASVLASLKVNGSWFDESFQGGYEDVDMAWRIRRSPWCVQGGKVLCVGGAHVWLRHSERLGKKMRRTFRQRIREERNRIWMIWKNDDVGSMLKYSPWILASVLFSLSGLLGGLWALAGLSHAWKQRKLCRPT